MLYDIKCVHIAKNRPFIHNFCQWPNLLMVLGYIRVQMGAGRGTRCAPHFYLWVIEKLSTYKIVSFQNCSDRAVVVNIIHILLELLGKTRKYSLA